MFPRRALDDSIRVHVRIHREYVDRTRVAGERLTLTAGAEDVGIQHLA